MSSLSLLVLAAGMGSRYGGLKQIDPMGPSDETLLDYSVYDARRAGFDRVVFLIRHDIEAEFREKVGARYQGLIEVDYAFQQLDFLPAGFSVPDERKKPWGTAHAIWCAREKLSGPFVAINADDFYGLRSYEVLAEFLKGEDPSVPRFAMAGYQLDRTLSEHGSVARGICQVDVDGHLTSVVECTGIEHKDSKIFQANPDGSVQTFTGREPVSMNFWGLTPAAFPFLEQHLSSFLQQNFGDLKAEYYIPSAIAEMIQRAQATVSVLPTDAPWFGVTYRDDKPGVVSSLQALHAQGSYPTPLWT